MQYFKTPEMKDLGLPFCSAVRVTQKCILNPHLVTATPSQMSTPWTPSLRMATAFS